MKTTQEHPAAPNVVRRSSIVLPIFMLLIPIAPVLLGLLILSLPVHVLEIAPADGGGCVFWSKVKTGDRFSLSYIHSVQLSRVTDDFWIDQSHRMSLVSTTFSDHGAGLPYGLERGEGFAVQDDGRFRVSDMDRPFAEIPLRVMREYGNTFVFGSRRINLSETCGDALLNISVKKRATFRYILRRVFNVG